MGIDPLSGATRTSKKNLLLASVVAITFRTFDVSVSSIPVAGLLISFDRGVFSFLIVVTLCYLLVTFSLYYYIDVRNFERTGHQSLTEKQYKDNVSRYHHKYMQAGKEKIDKSFSNGIYVHLSAEGALLKIQADGYDPDVLKAASGPQGANKLYRVRQKTEIGDRELPFLGNEVVYQKAAEEVERFLSRYVWQYRLYRMRLLPRLYGVHASYFIRNYLVDGLLPIALGLIGLAAVYNLVDLSWLKSIAPAGSTAGLP